MKYKVLSVVWLKKADTTTFEYLMQLKVCSVLLAVDVCELAAEYFSQSLCFVLSK